MLCAAAQGVPEAAYMSHGAAWVEATRASSNKRMADDRQLALANTDHVLVLVPYTPVGAYYRVYQVYHAGACTRIS